MKQSNSRVFTHRPPLVLTSLKDHIFFFQSLFFLLCNSYELSEKSSLKFVAKCKGKIVLPDTFSFGAFTQDMSLLIMDNGYNSGRNHSHDLSLDL